MNIVSLSSKNSFDVYFIEWRQNRPIDYDWLSLHINNNSLVHDSSGSGLYIVDNKPRIYEL